MASKKYSKSIVGHYHRNGKDTGMFGLPYSIEFDISAGKASLYFDVRKLTKNKAHCPLSVSEEELIDRGYQFRFKDFKIRDVRTRRKRDNLLRDIARGKGKGIIKRLLSDSIIK